MKLNVVFIGLSVTSSWGNGHATTYRALLEALARRGHTVTFLERDLSWYRENRDLADPAGWSVRLYEHLHDLPQRFGDLITTADLVVLGSYVPDGIAIGEWITSHAQGITAFYDIDTPVTLAGLDDGLDYITASMIPRFDLYLSFSGGPVPAMIEDIYGSPMARLLKDRQPQLDKLLLAPACQLSAERFVVAGAQYPDEIVWPNNINRIQHLAPADHASFFAAQRFTLNVTRADMRSLGFSPSVRLFEAAACGAPIISDRWPGIETIFTPSTEILLADDARDVVQFLTAMPDDKRLSIADRARRRILADHTPEHRARQLETYYREALDRRKHAPARATSRNLQAAEI